MRHLVLIRNRGDTLDYYKETKNFIYIVVPIDENIKYIRTVPTKEITVEELVNKLGFYPILKSNSK